MDNFEHCLNLELRKANRVLTQVYDSFLSTVGLKTSQFSVLRAIYYLKQTTNKDLQDVLVLDQTTLSRSLKPLIRDGFVFVSEGMDRRQKQLQLSSEGKTLFKDAEKHWKEAQAYVSDKLGNEVKQGLLDVSGAIVNLKK